jgi:hypothetical protein
VPFADESYMRLHVSAFARAFCAREGAKQKGAALAGSPKLSRRAPANRSNALSKTYLA